MNFLKSIMLFFAFDLCTCCSLLWKTLSLTSFIFPEHISRLEKLPYSFTLIAMSRILYMLFKWEVGVRKIPGINLIVVIQLLSHVWLFATPQTTAHQVSLSSTISRSLLKLMAIELVMLSNHLGLCCPLLLLPSVFPSIRVFSNESVLRIRWPKYWSFSFSISPSNEYSGLISFDWFDLLAIQGALKNLLQTTVWKHQFFGVQPSLWSSSHIRTWLLEKP